MRPHSPAGLSMNKKKQAASLAAAVAIGAAGGHLATPTTTITPDILAVELARQLSDDSTRAELAAAMTSHRPAKDGKAAKPVNRPLGQSPKCRPETAPLDPPDDWYIGWPSPQITMDHMQQIDSLWKSVRADPMLRETCPFDGVPGIPIVPNLVYGCDDHHVWWMRGDGISCTDNGENIRGWISWKRAIIQDNVIAGGSV